MSYVLTLPLWVQVPGGLLVLGGIWDICKLGLGIVKGTRALYDKSGDFNIPSPKPIYTGMNAGIDAYEFRCRYWSECVERWYSFLNENRIEEAKNVWFHVGNEMEHWD